MRHNSGLREDDRQETEGQRQPPEAEILLGLEELRWIMEGQEQPCSSGEIPEPREGDTLRLRGELPVHHQQDVDLPPWCAAVRRRRLLPAGN